MPDDQMLHRYPRGYLPTLDGWRAIAILAVIFSHDSLHSFGPFSTRWLFINGQYGVDVFFAISGILICSRLLEEESLHGKISLRNFYIRRAFRILPAAVAYLATIAILGAIGLIRVYPSEVISSLLFFRNYPGVFHLGILNPPAWFTAHFWSLSLEEHFYFLLPGVLVLFRGRRRVFVLSGLSLLVIGNQAFQVMHHPFYQVVFRTDVRLYSLLIPALLAVVVRFTPGQVRFYALLRFWPIIALVTIAVIVLPLSAVQVTVIAFLMPCVIMGSILYFKNPIGRCLELPPIRYVGKISYSVYLWQMIFYTGHLYPLRPLGVLESWPYNLVATFTMAMLSYHCLELPMIRIGHRIAPSAMSGGRGLT